MHAVVAEPRRVTSDPVEGVQCPLRLVRQGRAPPVFHLRELFLWVAQNPLGPGGTLLSLVWCRVSLKYRWQPNHSGVRVTRRHPALPCRGERDRTRRSGRGGGVCETRDDTPFSAVGARGTGPVEVVAVEGSPLRTGSGTRCRRRHHRLLTFEVSLLGVAPDRHIYHSHRCTAVGP